MGGVSALITCVSTEEVALAAPPSDLLDALVSNYENKIRSVDLPALRSFARAQAPLAEAIAWPGPLTQARSGMPHAWVQLPNPTTAGGVWPQAFKAIGHVVAPFRPTGMAQAPAYAGSQVLLCASQALPQLLAEASAARESLRKLLVPAYEKRAQELQSSASREGPRSEAARALKGVNARVDALRAARTADFDAIDNAGVAVGRVDPAVARYSFWSRLAKMIESAANSGADLAIIAPPDPARRIIAKWVSAPRLVAGFSAPAEAAWDGLIAACVGRHRNYTEFRLRACWSCCADRVRLLAEARRSPTCYAEGSQESMAVDYLLNLAQVGLSGFRDPQFKDAWQSGPARGAEANLQWALGEAVSGRLDAAALARVDGASDPAATKAIQEFWRVNEGRLARVLEQVASRPELSLVFSDCTEIHAIGSA